MLSTLRSCRIGVPFVALAVALVGVLPAEAATKKEPSCQRAGSRTVAHNSFARVYEVKSPEAERRLYGCRRSTGKRVLLDTAGDDFAEYLITDYDQRQARRRSRRLGVVLRRLQLQGGLPAGL